MKRLAAPFLLLLVLAEGARAQDEPTLYDPYERVKNGPPLSDVWNKATPDWLLYKIMEPRHHPSARMPDFGFAEREALDILAYLQSIAGEPGARADRDPWTDSATEDLDEETWTHLFGNEGTGVQSAGKMVWSRAGCAICHNVGGVGGEVDLRTGGIDLGLAGKKLRRDWLYQWLLDPKTYFPQTLMPRFDLDRQDRQDLAEWILRADDFAELAPPRTEGEEFWAVLEEPGRVERGRRSIELARCVVCHDIAGLDDLYEIESPAADRPADPLSAIAWDRRCLTCHRIEERGGSYAPDLTTEGSRLEESWIVRFLQDPGKHAVRNLVLQMPRLGFSEEEARALASYMTRFRTDPAIPAGVPGDPLTAEEARAGERVFDARGCVACHAPPGGPGGVVGGSLERVADRLRPGYLWRHMTDPRVTNRISSEPSLGLSDLEIRELAAFLLGEGK